MSISGLGIGIYSVPEAARLTRVPQTAIRRWLWGQRYKKYGEARESPPLWEPQHPVIGQSKALGFLDLMELRFVHAFREGGVSMPTIRRALERARGLWDAAHPFTSIAFRTDGRGIFADYLESPEEKRILMALPSGQLLFDYVLDHLYSGMVYEGETLARWHPMGEDSHVLIDPKRNFGHPIVDEGVPTEVLFESYSAEGSVEVVSKWFGVTPDSVEDAINYELKLAA